MSIPGNTTSDPRVPGQWRYPASARYRENLVDYEQGGVALGDTSQGNDVVEWRCRYQDPNFYIAPDPFTPEILVPSSPSVPGATRIAMTLTQNMSVELAWEDVSGVSHWWFDISIPPSGQYVIDTYPGVRSPCLTLDDRRANQINNAVGSIILLYLDGQVLKHRDQQDRYLVEYTLKDDFEPEFPVIDIGRVGMANTNRFQFEERGFRNDGLP